MMSKRTEIKPSAGRGREAGWRKTSSLTAPDQYRLYSRLQQLQQSCDDFKIKRASDVVSCVAVPGMHTFLFMAERLELKVSCKPLALIIVLLMRIVACQGCLMDTKHHRSVAVWVSHASSDLMPSLSR